MCGRFTNRLTGDEIVRLYRLTIKAPPHNLPPRYNICPTDPVDVVTEGERSRNFVRMRWDLGARLDAICGKIKNDDDRREAMSVARMFLSARENAQQCAVDCAPYVHAKLQAVHHEHGVTGRYIISDKPMTEEEWIRERAATVIDVTPEE
jgi:putative SOS response-associated peptidase YedK